MTINYRNYACQFVAMLSLTVLSAGFAGCTKEKDENHAAKFNGTWSGTASCSGSSPSSGQLVFTATDNKTVTTNYSAGTGSCVQGKVLTGTANGNNVTFNTITVTDGCGLSYSVSATGTLVGSTLTFTLSVNGAANGTCTFSGTK
jgi:hypothetical protein